MIFIKLPTSQTFIHCCGSIKANNKLVFILCPCLLGGLFLCIHTYWNSKNGSAILDLYLLSLGKSFQFFFPHWSRRYHIATKVELLYLINKYNKGYKMEWQGRYIDYIYTYIILPSCYLKVLLNKTKNSSKSNSSSKSLSMVSIMFRIVSSSSILSEQVNNNNNNDDDD